jgi:hypothetical protein
MAARRTLAPTRAAAAAAANPSPQQQQQQQQQQHNWRRSLQRLALAVGAIRVAYLALTLLLARVLPDYDTSAELASGDCRPDWPVRAAALARERAAEAAAAPASLLLPPPPSPSSWGLVWDAVFYHRIAACGYEYEQMAAFFPGFPAAAGRLALTGLTGGAAARWARWRQGPAPPPPLAPPPAPLSPRAFAAAGLVINNLAFVAAAVLLAHLGRAVLGSSGEEEYEEQEETEEQEGAAAAAARRCAGSAASVERRSLAAALLFGLQPASIFTAIPYTESLFAMLTFAGLCCLYCPLLLDDGASSSSSSSSSSALLPLAAAGRRLARALRFEAAALFFCLAACLRSNGAVNAAFLLHAGAAAALGKLLPARLPRSPRRPPPRPGRKRGAGGGGDGSGRGSHGSSALAALAAAALAALLPALRAVLCAAAVLAPYVLFQRHVAAIFCDGAPVQGMAAGGSSAAAAAAQGSSAPPLAPPPPPPPAWCGAGANNARLPLLRSSYAHVQARYWGVGPLAYWRARQLPNFLLASPALALALAACAGLQLRAQPRTLLLLGGVLPSASWERRLAEVAAAAARAVLPSRWWVGAAGAAAAPRKDGRGVSSSPTRRRRRALAFSSSRRAAVFAVQAAALALFAALTMNVQVATRMLFSSCPALYWAAAEVGGLGEEEEQREEEAEGEGARRRAPTANLLLAYFAVFALAGAVLNPQFLPWT